MTYAIFGVNRMAKDFLYIFDELDVALFFRGEGEPDSWECFSYPIYDIEACRDVEGQFDQIIVVGQDKDKKKRILKSYGLVEGEDFVDVDLLIETLDEHPLNPQKKPIIVWGTGEFARKFRAFYGVEEVEFFIDSYKKDALWVDSGKEIRSPESVENWKQYFVIVAVAKHSEIIAFLESEGMQRNQDYCMSSEWLTRPSWMMKRTLYDNRHFNVACRTFFSHIELAKNGMLNGCCVPFVTSGYGNINEQPYEKIWSGLVHKLMCLSANNRTYSFCDSQLCPVFIGRQDNYVTDLNVPYVQMDENPKNLLVNFEESCNLMCESCRNQVKIATGEIAVKNEQYAEFLIEEILPHCEFLIMAGTGEVFVGDGYKKIYENPAMKNLKYFRLLTNGTLFNEKNWKKIRENSDAKIILTVSIDAATKATYEEVRRGGNFEVLKKNMEFAGKLRKNGELSYFRLNFVVQKKNYKEMPLFVEWGKELGVDEVFFTKILNYGTYSQEEFKEISMYQEGNVIPKPELIEVLNHPIMEDKIVDLGTIRYHHEPMEVDEIDNYYRWELERKVEGLFDGG